MEYGSINPDREWIRLRRAYGATGYEWTRRKTVNRSPEILRGEMDAEKE
jgi:hypothetical protein